MDKKSVEPIGGPFVATAVLCTGISEDSNGIISINQIIDELRAVVPQEAPEDFPSKSHTLDISLWALIMLRRGDARTGKHKLRLIVEAPDGKKKEILKSDVEMPEFPNGMATIKAKMAMNLHTPGVFWIDVILDKERLTRMALNLKIQRLEKSATEAK